MAPKLNSHCWYDIKLAAAKKPDLTEIKVKEKKGFKLREKRKNRRKKRERRIKKEGKSEIMRTCQRTKTI